MLWPPEGKWPPEGMWPPKEANSKSILLLQSWNDNEQYFLLLIQIERSTYRIFGATRTGVRLLLKHYFICGFMITNLENLAGV